jgi:GH15 family glucan-1,4-alpha-glucosidase
VRAGQRVPFVLTWAPGAQPRPRPVDAEAALAATTTFWQRWSGRSRVQGRYRDAVQRSLVTLKALTFAPTGGIVAAPTTSLPEQIGGSRNWDYRYCWLRDATLTLQSLLVAGYTHEAAGWREWLLRAIAGDPAKLQIMYGIEGARRLPEFELPWLAGYEGSAPVRVGNAAAQQFQLDVWGEVLDGLSLTRSALLHDADDSWDIQVALMEHLEGRGTSPTTGCGRCVDRVSTSRTRRSWHGSPPTEWLTPSTSAVCQGLSSVGRRSATESMLRCLDAASTTTSTRSSSPMAPPTWMPACC